MNRLIKSISISIAVFLTTAPLIALAIPDADVQTVNTVEAYQSTLATSDQLYIVTYSLGYTVPPADSAKINFLFRLLDNGVQIASTAPSDYHDEGYNDGAVSFYFAADDADLPTWGTANLSVQFIGNPALLWDGGAPVPVTYPSVDSWTVGTATLPARIRFIAKALQSVWVLDLLETVNSRMVFTAEGEEYFDEIIPNLRLITPSVYLNTSYPPDYVERSYSEGYATTAEDRWVGDPVLDTTNAATALSMGRVWLNSLIWVGVSLAIAIVMAWQLKKVRPVGFLFGVSLVIGAFAGFVDFEVGIYVPIIGAGAVVLSIFYRGAN